MTDAAKWTGPRRRVVVTGGAGFIGRHVVHACLSRGDRVVSVDREPLSAPKDLDAVQVDLAALRHSELVQLLEGATDLIHLAAEKHNVASHRPRDILRTNVLGTGALFRAVEASSVRRVVFASSLYAHGRCGAPPLSESEPARPTTTYGISKLAGERMLAALCARGRIQGAALRYFFVYGPGQDVGEGNRCLIPTTLSRLTRGLSPKIVGDGLQVLDYVYVDDVVDATLAALDAGLAGQVIHIGSGAAVPVKTVIDLLVAASGTAAPAEYAPADATAQTERVADIRRAADMLGWRPQVPLDEGLERTAQAFFDAPGSVP